MSFLLIVLVWVVGVIFGAGITLAWAERQMHQLSQRYMKRK